MIVVPIPKNERAEEDLKAEDRTVSIGRLANSATRSPNLRKFLDDSTVGDSPMATVEVRRFVARKKML